MNLRAVQATVETEDRLALIEDTQRFNIGEAMRRYKPGSLAIRFCCTSRMGQQTLVVCKGQCNSPMWKVHGLVSSTYPLKDGTADFFPQH